MSKMYTGKGAQHGRRIAEIGDAAAAGGSDDNGVVSNEYLIDVPTHGYHDELGAGRIVFGDGDVVSAFRGPQEASVDGQGGTIRGKTVFTIDQAAFYLNRGDGLFVENGITYGSGASRDNAPGTANNEWFFTAIGKNNGGKAESYANGGDANANGTLQTINFGFYETLLSLPEPYIYRAANGNLTFGMAVAQGFSTFSADQRAATREAIAAWDDLVKVNFAETSAAQGDINFMNTTTGPAQASAYLPYDYGNSSTKNFAGKNVSFYEISGDVFVATPSKNGSNAQLDEGQYGLTTLIHEIGHSLGLEHPGDYNFGPNFTATYANGAEYYQDSNMYSIMSYWDGEETGSHYVDWEFMNYNYAATPMVHDVAAIQRIYGVDTTTRTGDTTYGFNVSADAANRDAYDFTKTPAPIMTIWDAGGNDTLDLSGYSTPSIIDLNPGAYSSAGGFFSEDIPTLGEINARRAAAGRVARTQVQYDQYVALFGATYLNGLLTDNIGIAYGAVIENAKGGAGADSILGNDVDNLLVGNGGKDLIRGGKGNDTLEGGDGDDILVGGAGADKVDGGAGVDLVSFRDVATALNITVASNGKGTVRGTSDTDGDVYINVEGFEGGAGNDTMTGSSAADILFGFAGNDVIKGGNGNDRLNGGDGNDELFGENGVDTLEGGAGNDRLDGDSGNDQLFGGAGLDTLLGGNGNDLLIGGGDADVLTGGSGFDLFVFNSAAQIGTLGGAHDRITDFQASADKIDLSALYTTDAAVAGFQLRFDGERMSSTGEEALGRAYDVSVYSEGGKTFIVGDVTGDGVADFGLELTGTLKLKSSDFITNEAEWDAFAPKIGGLADYATLHDVML